MRRSTVLFVMLFAMLWQSVALARAGSTANALADLGHAALHWQEEGHHHHEDGSYHLDESKESAQHVLSDHVSAAAALMVPASHAFPPRGRPRLAACTTDSCPTPRSTACSGHLGPAPDPPSRRASAHGRPAFR